MRKQKSVRSVPTCVFCKRSAGVQFVIFNPRFQPFGTACVDCEKSLPPGTELPPKAEIELAKAVEDATILAT